jgi:hypothetical protein
LPQYPSRPQGPLPPRIFQGLVTWLASFEVGAWQTLSGVNRAHHDPGAPVGSLGGGERPGRRGRASQPGARSTQPRAVRRVHDIDITKSLVAFGAVIRLARWPSSREKLLKTDQSRKTFSVASSRYHDAYIS